MTSPHPGAYTNDELGRLVAANAAQIQQIAQRLDGLLDRMDDRYQRRDLAEALAAQVMNRVTDLGAEVESIDRKVDRHESDRQRRIEESEKEARATRRWLISAMVLPVLTAVVSGLLLAWIIR